MDSTYLTFHHTPAPCRTPHNKICLCGLPAVSRHSTLACLGKTPHQWKKTVTHRRITPRFVLMALLALYCAELTYFYQLLPHPIEDAYISFRHACNLAGGLGPVFNPGERVEGCTNFLWMVFLALGRFCGAAPESFSRLGAAMLSAAGLVLVWYMPRRHFGVRGLASLAAPVCYLTFAPLPFYAASGLETALYTLLLLLATHFFLTAQATGRGFTPAAFFFLLLFCTRPDGALFFTGALAWAAITRRPPRHYLPGLALFAAGAGALTLWRTLYYGDPVPNTYFAKSGMPLYIHSYLAYQTVKGFAGHYTAFSGALVLLLVWYRCREGRFGKLAPLLLLTGTGLAFIFCCAGFDWMPFFRYLVPVMPLVMIVLAVCGHRWQQSRGRRRLLPAAMAGVFVLLLCEQLRHDAALIERWGELDRLAFDNTRIFAEWVGRELGHTASIATGDVGRFGYFSDVPLLDIMGLTSREFGRLRAHHDKPDIDPIECTVAFTRTKKKERELLLQARPDYVMLYTLESRLSESYFCSAAGIADHPDFQRQYDYMTSFYYTPRIDGSGWPRLKFFTAVEDLSAGLLAWVNGEWGLHIYRCRSSLAPCFRIDYTPEHRLQAIRIVHDQEMAHRQGALPPI